eukprot:scaffold8638_cov77-Cylindrotheca_fusiformis.AAC.2
MAPLEGHSSQFFIRVGTAHRMRNTQTSLDILEAVFISIVDPLPSRDDLGGWSEKPLGQCCAFLIEKLTMPNTDDDNDNGGSFWETRIVGDYEYGRLCTPRLNPWKKDNQEPLPYYGRHDRLALLVALFLGFQHSLAVVGGTVLPGILIGAQDPSGEAANYLVSYA